MDKESCYSTNWLSFHYLEILHLWEHTFLSECSEDPLSDEGCFNQDEWSSGYCWGSASSWLISDNGLEKDSQKTWRKQAGCPVAQLLSAVWHTPAAGGHLTNQHRGLGSKPSLKKALLEALPGSSWALPLVPVTTLFYWRNSRLSQRKSNCFRKTIPLYLTGY